MGRSEVQTTRIPSTRKSSCIIISDDEAESKKSTCLCSTMSPVRNVICKYDQRRVTEIQDMIRKHEKVFQDLPMKIPPNREIEHTIEFKAGLDPNNIKPYRDFKILS